MGRWSERRKWGGNEGGKERRGGIHPKNLKKCFNSTLITWRAWCRWPCGSCTYGFSSLFLFIIHIGCLEAMAVVAFLFFFPPPPPSCVRYLDGPRPLPSLEEEDEEGGKCPHLSLPATERRRRRKGSFPTKGDAG